MRILSTILLLSIFVSCKTKQKVVVPIEMVTTASTESSKPIIEKHYAVNRDFKTAYIKADVDYKDDKQSLGLSADIRIKKNEIILISVKMLGITMAKAMITPTQVRYYEKLGGKFFKGDYNLLSNWLGTDLDYLKVQNLLIGEAIDDLNKFKYNVLKEGETIKLEEATSENFTKSYSFQPNNFQLIKQEIIQNSPERKFLINYSNYNLYPESVLPLELLIFALQKNENTAIKIEYKNVTFNQELTYPYSVPSGYDQIIIK